MNRIRYKRAVRRWRRAYLKTPQGSVRIMPATVVARCCYSVARQRFLGVPYRRYIAIEIVGHGWTQALSKRDIEYMVLDYLISMNEDTTSSDYKVVIEWN